MISPDPTLHDWKWAEGPFKTVYEAQFCLLHSPNYQEKNTKTGQQKMQCRYAKLSSAVIENLSHEITSFAMQRSKPMLAEPMALSLAQSTDGDSCMTRVGV